MIEKINKVDIKEEDKNQNIKKIKETNNIFKNVVKMNRNELIKLDDSQLSEKLKIIIPNHKKYDIKNKNDSNIYSNIGLFVYFFGLVKLYFLYHFKIIY